jgi:error-prone DNA polymerase
VRVLPVDVNASDWRCRWEERPPAPDNLPGSAPAAAGSPAGSAPAAAGSPPGIAPAAAGACRIGLRYVSGLRRETAERIAAERRTEPFRSVEELKRRATLRGDEMARLSETGALASLGLTRRAALWQAALAVRPKGVLFEERASEADEEAAPSPLPEMSPYEETVADFTGTGLTVGAHPLAYARPALRRRGVVTAVEVPRLPAGTRTRIAGAVIVRQRPGTANGTLFVTLEDETGMVQAIVKRALLVAHRATIVGNSGLVIEGVVQQRDGSVSLQAEKFWPLADLTAVHSHDFH